MSAIIHLPTLPTRKEIADFCNARRPDRPNKVTPRMVKYWQEEGLLAPHRAFSGSKGRVVRYPSCEVVRFLGDNF